MNNKELLINFINFLCPFTFNLDSEEYINHLIDKFLLEFEELEIVQDTVFTPPWNIIENPEKTEGWIEFQKTFMKNPHFFWNKYEPRQSN